MLWKINYIMIYSVKWLPSHIKLMKYKINMDNSPFCPRWRQEPHNWLVFLRLKVRRACPLCVSSSPASAKPHIWHFEPQYERITWKMNGGDTHTCMSNVKVHVKPRPVRGWTGSTAPPSRGLGPGSLCVCGWFACAAAAAAAAWSWAAPGTTGSTGWSVWSRAGTASSWSMSERTVPPAAFWAPRPRRRPRPSEPERCLGPGCAATRGPSCVWSCSLWRGIDRGRRLIGWGTWGVCHGWF